MHRRYKSAVRVLLLITISIVAFIMTLLLAVGISLTIIAFMIRPLLDVFVLFIGVMAV